MAKLNLGSIYLKIYKSISISISISLFLSLYLDAKKSSIAKLLPLKNTNKNTNKSKKIRLPFATNQKQSRYLNKECLMSFFDSFSPQALQGSQGKTEAKKQDTIYPTLPLKLLHLRNAKGAKGQEGCVKVGLGLGRPDPTQAKAYPSPTNKQMMWDKYKNFNSYLAGLFEGDGHIWFPNINWKKKHNPRFCITFALKNEPLAKKILEIIEYGHIRYKPKENACVLIVSPVKGLKKII